MLALALFGSCAAASSAFAHGTTKVVRYHGYAIVVPAAWPVFDLSKHPSVCVRFDRHAVYLGAPSADQSCPDHAVGRTEAILVQPLTGHFAAASEPALPQVSNAGAERGDGTSVQFSVPARGIAVTATWAGDPQIIKHALRLHSLHQAPAAAARAASASATAAKAKGRTASAVYTGLGFDACSAPSTGHMSAWTSSSYRAVGVYIGGTNMACSQSNLNSGWVSTESAAGWHLVPTYVGLQAPSNGCGCASINPGQASAEGSAAASDAVSRAQAIGIGSGSPIYYDMENYTRNSRNTSAVLNFLSAWTSKLHADGYKSGVYSNADSGIRDLVAARGSGVAEPDDIWFADWNGEKTTSTSYVPAGDWSNHQRLHQYEGGHNETHGGVTINVDSNYLDGATAGGSAPSIPDGTFVQVSGTDSIFRIAGGAPLFVSNWNAVGGPQPYTVISQGQFDALRSVPLGGTFLETEAGDLYRVAGGAPLFVSNQTLFPAAKPVVIDQWDLDNISNPLAHLREVPKNGTFLTTTAGRHYRVAGGAPIYFRRWSLFGGVHPSVKIDPWDISNTSNPLAHLSRKPANGTIVEGLPTRAFWIFKAGYRRTTAKSRAAVAVGTAGLAAFPAVPCVVPSLRRMTENQVKHALLKADCRLGKVRRLPHASSGVQYVTRQDPRPNSKHPAGYLVAITLA